MTTRLDHLLGDYAAEALSATERRELFEAALRDQEIFDRLLEEERWRQLLSIPEVRRELRSALAEPPVPEPAAVAPPVAPASAPGFFAALRGWVEALQRPVLPLALGTVAALLLVVALLPRTFDPGRGATDLPHDRGAGAGPPRVAEGGSSTRSIGSGAEGLSDAAAGEPGLVAKGYRHKSAGDATLHISYAVELNRPSGPVRVPESHRFEPRDQFRLRLETDFTAWLYVFNRAAGEDEAAVLYPTTAAEREPAAPRQEVLIPSRVWLTMDDTPEDEELVLVVATQPWPASRSGAGTLPAAELEAALRRAESRLAAMSWRRSVVDERVRIEAVREEEGLVMVLRLLGG